MKLFWYAVLKHPSKEEKESGKSTEIIVAPQTALARDENQAAVIAGRAIPETEMTFLDRIEVAVAPF